MSIPGKSAAAHGEKGNVAEGPFPPPEGTFLGRRRICDGLSRKWSAIMSGPEPAGTTAPARECFCCLGPRLRRKMLARGFFCAAGRAEGR